MVDKTVHIHTGLQVHHGLLANTDSPYSLFPRDANPNSFHTKHVKHGIRLASNTPDSISRNAIQT